MKWILIILIFVSVGCRRDVDSATKTYTQQKGDEPPTDLILIIDGRVEVGNIVGCIDFFGNDTILSVDTSIGGLRTLLDSVLAYGNGISTNKNLVHCSVCNIDTSISNYLCGYALSKAHRGQ